MKEVVIEIYHGGHWHEVATFVDSGTLNYNIDYVLAHMDADRLVDRVGVNYPVNFADFKRTGWPAFLLDLLPAGPARAAWVERLNLKDDESADWPLLCFAAGCPPGNLRIASAAMPELIKHPGFERDEIIDRNIDFIEYAEANGALIAGASSVQGQAPKFLLVEDHKGRWHAEGALAEDQVRMHWLVKFPRGKKEADRQVLRNEAPYYEVARAFGLKTATELIFQDDSLFIQRFDRKVTTAGIERYGLESMASICESNTFGQRIPHNAFCKLLPDCVVDPLQDLLEYLKRDILNLAMGNTDNHGRNTAVLKRPDGVSALSPLFDFAPMFLDPEGIPRSSRWEQEKATGTPEWGLIAEVLNAPGISRREFGQWFAAQAIKVEGLPDLMENCGVEPDIIEKLNRRINNLARTLRDAESKTFSAPR